MKRDVYSGWLRLDGEEHRSTVTIMAANNYAVTLRVLQRFEEVKSLLRKMMHVAPRVLGENDETTLTMRWNYAEALVSADNATVDDLHEAVTTLEETARIARRVFGGSHPFTSKIEGELRGARAALRARETG